MSGVIENLKKKKLDVNDGLDFHVGLLINCWN